MTFDVAKTKKERTINQQRKEHIFFEIKAYYMYIIKQSGHST